MLDPHHVRDLVVHVPKRINQMRLEQLFALSSRLFSLAIEEIIEIPFFMENYLNTNGYKCVS